MRQSKSISSRPRKNISEREANFEASEFTAQDNHSLVYLRARYYSPELGRFISQDPVKGSINNPSSLNRYAYVSNNPINLTDPSGLIPRNVLGLASMFSAGFCSVLGGLFQQDDPCKYCTNPIEYFFCNSLGTSPCPPPPAPQDFITNTPQPTLTPSPTLTPTLTPTPSPTYTPTDSPDVNPCNTRTMQPVFGNCGDKCIPRVAGSAYTESHQTVDIVPLGAYENYPESTYLNPSWSTSERPLTAPYKTVYAVTGGTLKDIGLPDAVALRLPGDVWEFAYVHINPVAKAGSINAGEKIGDIIWHGDASFSEKEGFQSDVDHLHFGLRTPDLKKSLDPSSCLPGLG